MKRYQIVKKIAGSDAQYISLHPYVNNDETYEFDTIEEAQNKLKEIKEWSIYKDIELIIMEVDYSQ